MKPSEEILEKLRNAPFNGRSEAIEAAMKIDPKLASTIRYSCYNSIFRHIKCNDMLDEVMPYIVKEEWAFELALYLCGEDVDLWLRHSDTFRSRIKSPEWAYRWARQFGDHEIMRPLITESEWAYMWGYYIGDRDIMRPLITESHWAFTWACNIGDRDIMRDRVTDQHDMWLWWLQIGWSHVEERDIILPRITDPKYKQLISNREPD